MSGYVIAQVEITDLEKFKKYQEQVPATVAKHGGEYLVRGGAFEVREGDFPDRRVVVLRFPSVAVATEWYESDDYAGPMVLRKASTVTNLIIVAGYDE